MSFCLLAMTSQGLGVPAQFSIIVTSNTATGLALGVTVPL
jgi:hypothetical protein